MQNVVKIASITLLIVHYSLFTIATAQPKIDSTTKTAVANAKLVPALGAYKNGSKAFAADLKKLIKVNSILTLKDEKGISYAITSFEFTWRQKSIADDVITGKRKVNYTTVGQKFIGNRINEDWVQEITEVLNVGDELNFDTILYFDAKKHKTFLAPDLKISIY